MRISVLGLGNWGTAIAHHLAGLGNAVVAWTRSQDIADGINRNHRNPRYLSSASLSEQLVATVRIEETLSSEMIVFAVSTEALPSLISSFGSIAPSVLVVSAMKGLIEEGFQTPLQFLLSHTSLSKDQAAVFAGPCFAKDLIRGLPAGLVAASSSQECSERVAKIFSGQSVKVYTSTDSLGAELGGALKNIIAIAVGVSDGLGLGDSARAGLITRGLAEITRLSVALGADPQTLSGLSGLGDLAMTASSDSSRNRTVGLSLAQGKGLETILKDLGSVAEGVRCAFLAQALAQTYGISMPVTEAVTKLLAGSKTPLEMVQELVQRPLRSERD